VDIVGHRGACGHAPENTLKSFAKGIELGCQRVELDVHVSKDGALVVIHDATVERTTNGRGAVRDKLLEEIKQLDAGGGQRIPTLLEVMDLCRGKVDLQIELKAIATPALVAEHLKKHWNPSKAIVTSFNLALLDEFGEIIPQTPTGLLNRDPAVAMIDIALKHRHRWICPRFDVVNRELVDLAHAHNLLVYVYHVNQREHVEGVFELGADSIGTDYPEIVVGQLVSKSRQRRTRDE